MSQITSYTVTQLISQKKQGLTSLDITLAYLERIKASCNNAAHLTYARDLHCVLLSQGISATVCESLRGAW